MEFIADPDKNYIRGKAENESLAGVSQKMEQDQLGGYKICTVPQGPTLDEPHRWINVLLSLGQEDPLEEGMAAHSSILAWRFSWTEEPGRLQAIVWKRIRHN